MRASDTLINQRNAIYVLAWLQTQLWRWRRAFISTSGIPEGRVCSVVWCWQCMVWRVVLAVYGVVCDAVSVWYGV